MPRPPNPRRTTLGPVSMNRNSSGGGGSTNIVGSGPLGGGTTPSKIPKPRKSRQSMLPRMGRENTTTTNHGTSAANAYPPSPSSSIVSMSSHSRRSIGGNGIQSNRPLYQYPGRQSLGGNNNININSVVKQDPRPIQDKAYQQHCIRTLLTFLTKSGYEYPVNLKSLAHPSGKDFTHIVTFLLKQVDATFGTADLKMEEEVALHFKALGYPYPVSKTALVAAGSPHTWPSLLAALAWLVEHLTVLNIGIEEGAQNLLDGASTKFESLAELENKTDKAFFQYLHRAYAAFLEGATDKSDLLIGNLIDMFEEDNIIIEREIERVTEVNATIAEKIHMLERQSETYVSHSSTPALSPCILTNITPPFCNSLPALAKKREDYATDLEQFHDLIRQMDDHCAALTIKVQDRTKELQQTNDDLTRISDKIEMLQQTIVTQPLTVEQVQKMHSEQARLKEALEKALAFKQFNVEGLDQSHEELSSLWEDLELLMREYNDEASELSRSVIEFSQQVQLKMVLHKEMSHDQTQLLGVDIAGALLPSLELWKRRNMDLLTDTRRQLENMLDDLEASKEALTEATDRDQVRQNAQCAAWISRNVNAQCTLNCCRVDLLQIVEMKLVKTEETFETERELQEATLNVRLHEVETIELKIESLRDPASLEEQMCALQRQCDSLERLKKRHHEETVTQKFAIQQEIEEAILAVEEYNRFVGNKLNELKCYAEHQTNSVRTLKY